MHKNSPPPPTPKDVESPANALALLVAETLAGRKPQYPQDPWQAVGLGIAWRGSPLFLSLAQCQVL